ncbi:hypothetical protein JW899_00405 [Candidatus Uhrbacteria bacterium]|nr:hypothetical protein [Candidatus Uhrbacteria bacterium]
MKHERKRNSVIVSIFRKTVQAVGKIGRIIRSHLRRSALEVMSFLLDRDALFRVIGFFNRRFGFLKTVFLLYPANLRYAHAYVYERRRKRMFWGPEFVGLFRQKNCKIGLVFGISSDEKMIKDPKNTENLLRVFDRMEDIRVMLGAERKSFAGILPSIFRSRGFPHDFCEAEVTVLAVKKAIEAVRKTEGMGTGVPTVVLGGRGLIGSQVVKSLSDTPVFVLDSAGSEDERRWPDGLGQDRVLLVNIASVRALESQVKMLHPAAVILNEAYPEPPKALIEKIREIGCPIYHIAGVLADWVLPNFSGAYREAIPCCAAWLNEDMEVSVIRLV